MSLAPQSQQQKTKIKEESAEDGEKEVEAAVNDSELNLSSDTEDSVYENTTTGANHRPLSVNRIMIFCMG